ncbi:MAG TPA: hypothetical protein VF715_17660 [Thermoleophilaceae bacterium]
MPVCPGPSPITVLRKEVRTMGPLTFAKLRAASAAAPLLAPRASTSESSTSACPPSAFTP